MRTRMRNDAENLVAAAALTGLAIGGVLHLTGAGPSGDLAWATLIVLVLIPVSWSGLRSLARGDVGVDMIAIVAMAAALALGEYLAGAVVGLMVSGGSALEAAAGRRARRELTMLVARAPKIAHRRVDSTIREVPVEQLAVGDVVLVRNGEVVPVDGVIESDEAVIDESTLTGESLPVTHRRRARVRSGAANAGQTFEMRVARPAAESTYAALVRLVEGAQLSRAPFVRLADRYAAGFLPLTLVTAGLAWLLSDDPIRALAVLVVATPCPLILAAPIALISGVSRAARAGVIVKHAGAIELLGETRAVLLDKTGTLTPGTPEIERITPSGDNDPSELLRLAASLDQLSAHTLAEAIVHQAEARGLILSLPEAVVEQPGGGIAGRVDGRVVCVGSSAWLGERGCAEVETATALDAGDDPGHARVLVGVDGRLAGVIVLADHVRADAAEMIAALRASGVESVTMVTGDRQEVADQIARSVGIDHVYAEQSPADKLAVVRAMRDAPGGGPVVMVGDGVNDAPALALADVGIAMGTAGATVSSETADAVITVDRIDRVADAIRIGRRSLYIARQSVVLGLGMSIVAMGFAAFGYLPPVAGALLQEGIDLAVILNALRALSNGR